VFTQMTSLHLAVKNEDCKVVSALLTDASIDVNAQNEKGETPLFLAVAANQPEIVKVLLGSPKTDINRPTSQQVTPLYIAAKNKLMAICEMLAAREDIKENIPTEAGMTPLMSAAKKGDYDLVYILYKAAKKLSPNEIRAEVAASLFLAIRKRHIDVVGLLVLDRDLDFRALSVDGETMLTAAVKTADKKIVNKFLFAIDRGLDVNQPNSAGVWFC